MTDKREWVLVPRELLEEARNIAMEWTLKGRVPECGPFGQIAQDLDAMLAAAPQPPIGGDVAMEAWHAAVNDAGELRSNAPDERYARRAANVESWIKANRPAPPSAPVGVEWPVDVLSRREDVEGAARAQRVAGTDAARNAIVPQIAAEFVAAFMDTAHELAQAA